MRYNPAVRAEGKNPFFLDSRAPSIPLKDYIYSESRYTQLERAHPDTAAELLKEATDDVERTWRVYSSRAAMPGRETTPNISPRNGHETNGHDKGAGAPAAKNGDQN
jgi:pyruvate-ferredoxin/flavodoxin oxidoreductase